MTLPNPAYIAAALARRIATAQIIQPPVTTNASGQIQNPPQTSSGQKIMDSTGLLSPGVLSVLINGGIQTSGPIAGVAAPPTGLSGTGGEVILTTGTFTLTRSATVMLLAICSDFFTTAVAHVAAHPVYFQVDRADNVSAYGFIPCFTNADAEARAQSTTILSIATYAPGAHTVNVIWNSEEGANDTCNNSNNPLFAFLLGS